MESVEANRQKVIQKCIDNSYEIKKKLSLSVSGWKNKLLNFKDSVKYNLVNLNTKFIPEITSIHVLYKIYNPKELKGLKGYNSVLNKFLLMTYRNNFKEQKNVKNNSTYTSDCGWGCMIRSSQMIFSRMLYKIFKYHYKNKFTSEIILKSIIPFFMDNNIPMSVINTKSSDYINLGMDSYISQLNNYLTKKIEENKFKKVTIKSIDPPFSIHKICILGELFGRTSGEWFSDFELPKIYEIINSTFNIIPNFSIMHFNTDLEVDTVMKNCLEKIDDVSHLDKKDYFRNEKNEDYILKKMGAVFVSVRLFSLYKKII